MGRINGQKSAWVGRLPRSGTGFPPPQVRRPRCDSAPISVALRYLARQAGLPWCSLGLGLAPYGPVSGSHALKACGIAAAMQSQTQPARLRLFALVEPPGGQG